MPVNTYPKKVVEVKHILLEQYKYRKETNISSYMFKVFLVLFFQPEDRR